MKSDPIPHRATCYRCRKAKVTCYCAQLRPFESDPLFVILAHPRELKNSVGTGRMLHLSITNSRMIEGRDFSHNEELNRLISDPTLHCAMLYPGARALDLSRCDSIEARAFVPAGKRLALILVDGTWDLARGMINRSANLKALPQLCFTPERPSAYEIRKQPEAYCLSTLECAHWLLDRFATLGVLPTPPDRIHDGLIATFRHMVRQQVQYAADAFESRGGKRTEGVRA